MNTQHHEETLSRSVVSWRAIFAGTFVALLVYMILLSLGLAVGGGNLQGVIEGEDSARNLGMGTAVWMIATILVSIFVGSFAAARVGGLAPLRVGRVEGLVVCALFFGVLLSQLGSAVGTLRSGVGSTLGFLGNAASDVASNRQVQMIINDAIGDLPLRSAPETVATGLASRLIRGNDQSAMNYLAAQTGVSRAEAQQRIATLKQDVSRVAADVGTGAAKAMKFAGWTLFGALLLGAAVAVFGGAAGATANLRTPVTDKEREAFVGRKATV